MAADVMRQHLRQQWHLFFQQYDALVCPVTMTTAFPHNQQGSLPERTVMVDGVERPYMELLWWTVLIGGVYLPSTVIPVGVNSDGMPIGVQVVGPYMEDRTALAVAPTLFHVAPSGENATTPDDTCANPDYGADSFPNGAEGAIEAAISAADPGATIVLCAGVFSLTTGEVDVTTTNLSFEGSNSASAGDTVVDGGGRVDRVDSGDSDYPGLFSASVSLGAFPGVNTFRIQAGSVRLDVNITGQ